MQKQVDFIAIESGQLRALKWLEGIVEAILLLAEFPDRCAIAPENEYLGQDSAVEIRHLICKKSFRVIFTVRKNEVRILSVKQASRLVS